MAEFEHQNPSSGGVKHQGLARVLAQHPQVKLAVLFGSLAYQQGRFDSDLDLAVAGESSLSAEEKVALIATLAEYSGRPIDLIDLRSVGGMILKEALTHGQIVYCTDRDVYAEMIKKLIFDQADFAPYRDRILAERRKAWIDA